MFRLIAFALCISTLSFTGCDDNNSAKHRSQFNKETAGLYRFSLLLQPEELPFTGKIEYLNDSLSLTFYNGDERIEVKNITISNDSIVIKMPVYQSVLMGRIESPDLITGTYYNYSRSDTTSIPFIAEKGKNYRFTNTKSSVSLPGQYHTTFVNADSSLTEAILILTNDQGSITGTFLTETGDYRYLEGNIMNERVYLSTFDGAHAYYFEARIIGDSLANGLFRSGKNNMTRWYGIADSTFSLRPPDQLTFLKEGYNFIDFALPNMDGDTVTWNDLNLHNQVVIIDIMGSWCPNCMDATLALKKLSEPYSNSELRIIPVAFEMTEHLESAKIRIDKMQKDLGIQEEFLFGGYASKNNATAAFPMLNHIISFPTLIVIDKNRNVKLIYTGFYGPGTGKYHKEFMEEMASLLSQLISGSD